MWLVAAYRWTQPKLNDLVGGHLESCLHSSNESSLVSQWLAIKTASTHHHVQLYIILSYKFYHLFTICQITERNCV